MAQNKGGKVVQATVRMTAAITQDEFRKLARTGEFTPPPPPEPQP